MTSYLATDALDLDPTEHEPEPKPRLHEDDFIGDPALLNAQTADERAAFWARIATRACEQREAAKAARDKAIENEREAYALAGDLAAQLADLRDGARLAQAAIDAGDKFSGGLLAQGLIARLLGVK